MQRKSVKPPLPDLHVLLQRVRDGDGLARERLFQQLRIEVRKQADRLVRERAPRGMNASDLAQETIERLLKCFEDFRGGSDGELRMYVRRILENCLNQLCRDAERQKRDERGTLSLEELGCGPPAEGPRVSQLVSRKQDRQRLLGAILTLPEAQRQTLWFHREGRKVAEIAQSLGRSEKAVASLLERAVHTLREDLRDDEHGLRPDEAQLETAFLRYLHALERGEVGDPETFLTRYTHEASGLRALLEGLAWLEEQLRTEENDT